MLAIYRIAVVGNGTSYLDGMFTLEAARQQIIELRDLPEYDGKTLHIVEQYNH